MTLLSVNSDSSLRRAGWLALGAVILTLGLITYGSWVRVSGSGLGCPDWPLCEGGLVPTMEGDTAIEFGHRLYAGVTMLVVAGSAWFAYQGRGSDALTAKLIVGAFAAIFAQAILGGITVLTELHGMVRLAHLTFAMLTLALLVSGALRALSIGGTSLPSVPRSIIATGLTGFVVLAGGSIVGTGESAGCPGLPLCDSRSSMEAVGLHTVHRVAATLLVLKLLWTAWQVNTRGGAGVALYLALAAAVVATAQFTVGVSAIVFDLPEALRILHLGLAATLWTLVVAQLTLVLKGNAQ